MTSQPKKYAHKTFKSIDWSGQDLAGEDFSNSILENVNLVGANLTSARLERTQMTDCDLTDANLTGASCWYASLVKTNLTGANLTGTGLQGVKLLSSDLTRANLTGAHPVNAKIEKTPLVDANLTGADLTETWIYYSDLTRVNLTGAFLKVGLMSVVLKDACLNGATFADAHFCGVDIAGADFRNVKLREDGFFIRHADSIQNVLTLSAEEAINADFSKIISIVEVTGFAYRIFLIPSHPTSVKIGCSARTIPQWKEQITRHEDYVHKSLDSKTHEIYRDRDIILRIATRYAHQVIALPAKIQK